MRRVEVIRLGFPSEHGDAVIGDGVDVVTGESVKFVVPPEQRLAVLAAAHRQERPFVELHHFDIVPWDAVLGVEWEDKVEGSP